METSDIHKHLICFYIYTQVQTGEVDMSLGGDQGGSIRLPASWTGIVGLKPTYGLVPYTGIGALSTAVDVCGPMTRTVKDCALMLEVSLTTLMYSQLAQYVAQVVTNSHMLYIYILRAHAHFHLSGVSYWGEGIAPAKT